MEDEIPDWTLRIDIEQEVWLNNAWCGTMEVHQGNNEQELDLRSVNPSKIILDKLDDPDILIPLEPGDYVIYHPSQKEYEMPIAPNGFKEIGFIFYSNQEDPVPAFSSVTLKCNPSSAYANKASVQVLIGLGIIWAISAIALVVFIIQMRRSEKMLRTQQELVEQTMQTISSFVDAKDEYTAGHSNRVASVARIIARRLGYGAEEQRQVYYCGLLHDSGKALTKTTDENNTDHFKGHALVSKSIVKTVLKRLKFDNQTINNLKEISEIQKADSADATF